MKKVFIKSFIILLFTTCTSKLLSIIARIIIARSLSSEGLGLYMLALPTLSLGITLNQMGIPNAVFKLIADKNYSNRKVIITAICLILFNSIILVGIFLFLGHFISVSLLKNKATLLSIYAIALFIPLASINNILRNYFLGKEKILTPGLSQITEEVVRIMVMMIGFNYLKKYNLETQVAFIFISMSAGEIASTIFMVLTSNLKSRLQGIKDDKIIDSLIYKDVLNISLPVTGGQLLNSASNFLQPIIITNTLSSLNYSSSYIQEQYGIINGYVLSMLMIPSFISHVVYRVILPRFTKLINEKSFDKLKKEFITVLSFSLLLGIPFTLLFYFFPETILQLFYSTNQGSEILKYAAIPFLITYLQTPISAYLHALDKNRIVFIITVLQNVSSIVLLVILLPKYKMVALIISFLVGCIASSLLEGIVSFYYLFFKKE